MSPGAAAEPHGAPFNASKWTDRQTPAGVLGSSTRMRIAQVSPLYESVPPRLYGGTERVVSYLTEELVRQGHDVTLYASGDSRTSARLRAVCDRALRLQYGKSNDGKANGVAHGNVSGDPLAWHMLLAETVMQEAGRFDIV